MLTEEDYVDVELSMPEIESVMNAGNLHINRFADTAWNQLQGAKVASIRASGLEVPDISFDTSKKQPGPVVVAYVMLPRVTFAGWVTPTDIRHPGRVFVSSMRPVRLLLPWTWEFFLSQDKPLPEPHTALGYLSQPGEK